MMHVRVLRTISGPRRYATAAISPTTWFFMAEADADLSTSASWSSPPPPPPQTAAAKGHKKKGERLGEKGSACLLGWNSTWKMGAAKKVALESMLSGVRTSTFAN